MKLSLYLIITKIELYKQGLGGVFSSADLCNLIGLRSRLAVARITERLVKEGVLSRVQRGIYTTKEFDLWRLASRIDPACYISMDSVLARNGLVSTVPRYSLSAVHQQRKRSIRTTQGTIRIYSISKDLFFGFSTGSNGVRIADSEKALLDLLYFYNKGNKFVFDPFKEVAINKLNIAKIGRYLERYRNPKFVKFVKGLLHEKY